MARTVTWGEIKETALKKMFSYTGIGSLMSSDNTEYVTAMPEAASEALMMLWQDSPPKAEATLNVTEGAKLDITAAIQNLYDAGGCVYWTVDASGIPAEKAELQLTAGKWIEIPAGFGTQVYVEYTPTAERITINTADSYVMQCGDERACLLPLYMAGELYKDDDKTLSTMYLNEFQAARNALKPHPQGIQVDTAGCLPFDTWL